MKAAVARRYGPPDVVALVEVPLPLLRPGQVHVEVGAAAVTVGDARIRAARAPAGMGLLMRLAFGLTRPRRPVLGMMFAGRMASAGARFNDGDRVIGTTGMAMGAHAEILAIDETRLLPLSDLSDSDAVSLLFGGMTAADFLIDKARLQPGHRLLVNGASGEVGCAAVQIARHIGAEVTAVCRAENHDLVRHLGARHCHDYCIGPPCGEWDAILDVAGTLPWARARGLLAPGGVLMPVTASLGQMLGAALRPRRGGRRITGVTTSDGPAALARVLDLARAGALVPVIAARLPLAGIVEAHALADSGHKRGSVVVETDQATETAMAAK
jgi:NADPH:quinone reductase-like Zn-dependent oxidoreductase